MRDYLREANPWHTPECHNYSGGAAEVIGASFPFGSAIA
jgi:hypothetical protein